MSVDRGPLKLFLISALVHRSGEIPTHRSGLVWADRSGEAVELCIDAIEADGYEIGEYDCREIPAAILAGPAEVGESGPNVWWAHG